MTKISFIVPTTSNKRGWKSYNESYLHNYLFQTVYTTKNDDFEYVFYLGFDDTDSLYLSDESIQSMKDDCKNKNFSLKITTFNNIETGHLTRMWNTLFKAAYEDGCDYFVQCGDDIEFINNGWLRESIESLKKGDDIGIVGPLDPNRSDILTQSIVGRPHMEIFGYYFPDEIKNWYCDDWISAVYSFTSLLHDRCGSCINHGGKNHTQRYTEVYHSTENFKELVKSGIDAINLYKIKNLEY
jgi:hypothetical protein